MLLDETEQILAENREHHTDVNAIGLFVSEVIKK